MYYKRKGTFSASVYLNVTLHFACLPAALLVCQLFLGIVINVMRSGLVAHVRSVSWNSN